MSYAARVEPGKRLKLGEIDPHADGGLDRSAGEAETAALGAEMSELLDLLFAAGQTALLIVLQGMDTSGKDGTIRHLLQYSNAQSTRVVPFKVPTEAELAHDFLWRIHAVTPGRGGIAVFNRSHYEDVLVVRVHEIVPEDVWRQRYEHIVAFERLLLTVPTVVLKFYLHISKDEQEERLRAREQDAVKSWKLSVGDWKDRALWERYVEAYEEALERCSTTEAPWYVVPADRKWFRNLAITERVVKALRPLRQGWLARLEQIGVRAKRDLAAYRAEQSGGGS